MLKLLSVFLIKASHILPGIWKQQWLYVYIDKFIYKLVSICVCVCITLFNFGANFKVTEKLQEWYKEFPLLFAQRRHSYLPNCPNNVLESKRIPCGPLDVVLVHSVLGVRFGLCISSRNITQAMVWFFSLHSLSTWCLPSQSIPWHTVLISVPSLLTLTWIPWVRWYLQFCFTVKWPVFPL